MNWLANGLCILDCFMVFTGTMHLIRHDRHVRYGQANAESWIQLNMPVGAKVGRGADDVSIKKLG